MLKKPLILTVSILLLLPLSVYCAEAKKDDKKKEKGKKEAPKEEKKEIKEYKRPKDTLQFSVPPYERPGLGVLFSYQDKFAKKVSVAGDFNNWNPAVTSMKRNAYGVWEALVPLHKGDWSYKYNVDGQWILDPKNFRRVSNDQGDIRSVVTVKTDFEFYFKPVAWGYSEAFPPRHLLKGVEFSYKDLQADEVSVAGDFNNWNKRQYPLKRNINGVWSAVVPLEKGGIRYKYCVDGLWRSDPNNPRTSTDDYGEKMSLLSVSNEFLDGVNAPHSIDRVPWKFTYQNRNIPSRYKISVIGDFNQWDDSRDRMSDPDQDKVWTGIVYLRPGSYLYRFKIEDEEFRDPFNHKVKSTADGREASFLEVFQPPDRKFVKFTLKPNIPVSAKRVLLAGDFNNWDLENTPMEYDPSLRAWTVTVDLPKGIYKYRYYLDSKWMLDMSNPNVVIDQNRETYSVLEVK